MPLVNRDTTLSDMLLDIQNRLTRLESQKNFNVPFLNTDPLYPKDGDMWVNSTIGPNGALRIYSNGAIHTIKNI